MNRTHKNAFRCSGLNVLFFLKLSSKLAWKMWFWWDTNKKNTARAGSSSSSPSSYRPAARASKLPSLDTLLNPLTLETLLVLLAFSGSPLDRSRNGCPRSFLPIVWTDSNVDLGRLAALWWLTAAVPFADEGSSVILSPSSAGMQSGFLNRFFDSTNEFND